MSSELVAGEPEDEEVRVGGVEFLPQGFEVLELRGEAAFGGCVHDENDLVLEGGEVVRLGLF